MTDNDVTEIPEPVEGKFIFQINKNMRVRYNAEGWIEEIGRGGVDDPLGVTLQGKAGMKRDDTFARRYYDLFTRIIIIDIYPKADSGKTNASGMIAFKDLEPDSHMYKRVNLLIAIANKHFNMEIKPLG